MRDSISPEVVKLVQHVDAVFRAVLNRPPSVDEFHNNVNGMLAGASPIDFFNAVMASHERQNYAKLFEVPGAPCSPIANPAELEEHARAVAAAGPELPGIAIDRAAMIALWQSLAPYLTSCPFPADAAPPYRYFYQNNFYGFADGRVLHAMLRRFRPRRYVEIGSGMSSACAVDTVDGFLDGACELTFIEPLPERRLYGMLGDRLSKTHVRATPVQKVPLDVFDALEANDVLFIDSSHVLKTGSDVAFELFEILPRLAPGVLVHVHDIMWPFDYPADWILKQNRSYNEAYAVRAFLMNNAQWRVTFFADWFAKFEGDRVAALFPDYGGSFGGSLWLERV